MADFAEEFLQRRTQVHEKTQALYRERFEENQQVNFRDLWDFISKKIKNGGENSFKACGLSGADSVSQYLHLITEEDEAEQLSRQLERALDDPRAPPEERRKAEVQLRLLQARPLQLKAREEVLQRYLRNKVALQNCKQATHGDFLFERQLVDRDFYKRAKIYSSSKKEARTLDRFEQQMRSGQELRKKTRHKEFLNEILYHANKFTEFHKKRQNFVKKKCFVVKASLESKEKKEQLARDKQERERIKLLKDNDIEGYINLINTQKNSRLLQILEQTHKYLEQLGAKVVMQKQESLANKRRKNEEGLGQLEREEDEEVKLDEYGNVIERPEQEVAEELNDNERIKSNLKNSSKVYYSITHTVQEEITEQPRMIKGG